MANAPYIYHGTKSVDAKIYEELKGLDYGAYTQVRHKYKQFFTASRPYDKTVNKRGTSTFSLAWTRTLQNLKSMYGYTPPKRTADWLNELRDSDGNVIRPMGSKR